MNTSLLPFAAIIFAGLAGVAVLRTKPTDSFTQIKSLKASQSKFEDLCWKLEVRVEELVLKIRELLDLQQMKKASKTQTKIGELVNYEVEKLFAGALALEQQGNRLLSVDDATVPTEKIKKAVETLQQVRA
ncbi:hypothetical protein [Asticcacaulis sp. AND118]|uniref:hypothetical protein n=1 Tax=Asticcacaulis sp. AND118 TaxID=2840468 RepID=UPI001CFF6985|nr:hypothetical protein [Asticcacaulis sp. AND118]UDF05074.1 hypothetical protein LH365_16925 [Asticcacaulis sp. AND118]